MTTRPTEEFAVSPLILRNVPLFADLSDEEVAKLAAVAVVRHFPKNTVIIQEGDNSDYIYLYLINSGKVKVLVSEADGREVILSILGPGDYFGEMSLIDRQPRSATVVTMGPVYAAVIAKADFDRCLADSPSIAAHVIAELVKRLRSANHKIEGLALVDVYGRVARTLSQLAELQDGRMVISQKLSQQDIADMVGASREMVSRTLKDLAMNGYISLDGKRIIVHPQRFAAEFN